MSVSFHLKHCVQPYLLVFWDTKSYLGVAKIERSLAHFCPKVSCVGFWECQHLPTRDSSQSSACFCQPSSNLESQLLFSQSAGADLKLWYC